MNFTVFAKCCAPPSGRSSLFTDVSTTYFSIIASTAFAMFIGSSLSSHPLGLPVSTEQNLQALVQTDPISIKVAVPADQHSLIFGQ